MSLDNCLADADAEKTNSLGQGGCVCARALVQSNTVRQPDSLSIVPEVTVNSRTAPAVSSSVYTHNTVASVELIKRFVKLLYTNAPFTKLVFHKRSVI